MSAVLKLELDDHRVGELLSLWERWMREGVGKTLELGPALNCRSFNAIPWGYWEHTSQEMTDAAEYAQAEKIHASIEDLETHHQMAIYHMHLHVVFRFARADIDRYYTEARQALTLIMPRHGVV